MTTCQYTGPAAGSCTEPATHLVDGVPYCTTDATGKAANATSVERIAPTPTRPATGRPARMTSVDRAMSGLTGLDSPSRRRGECHYCGQPLRGGRCEECQ